MNKIFQGPVAGELHAFLQFKRSLGYGYMRAEFTLREFDRFLVEYAAKNRHWKLDRAAIAWLSSKPGRKPISVSCDAAVLRQFYRYLRRSSEPGTTAEPIWPHLPTESSFVPYSLSEKDVLHLLTLCADLKRPPFRAALYRALILVLYCTGIRFGEALRLRMRDVDTRAAVLFVDTFKGRSRWVPFHRSLSRELNRYLSARLAYAGSDRDARLFVGVNQHVTLRNFLPRRKSLFSN
jgi:integrase